MIEAAQAQDRSIGIRHELSGSLSLDETSPYARLVVAKEGRLAVDLRTRIRVSDHSPEADFYGVVVTSFSDIGFRQPATETTIWQASRCHRDRGLPKITVIGVEGEIPNGEAKVPIAAGPRYIGKLLPEDEIVVFKRPHGPSGSLTKDWAIRARTKVSRIVLDLRLASIRCELDRE